MAFALCSAGLLFASPDAVADLTLLSLEELMRVEVYSVSKRPQPISEAAAAIHVITREDIRRSGATCVPEALRMAPGVQVARIDANKWAVTVRGFSGRYANKLLVLMDGRTLYDPVFSGVYWDVQDIFLEDIERIEVIRGPGASLWGANAVNGIINILTRSAKDSQGAVVDGVVGTREQGGGVRYGGAIGENVHYRAHARYTNRQGFADSIWTEAADALRLFHAGFRVDGSVSARDTLSVQGSIHFGESGERFVIPSLEDPYKTTIDQTHDLLGGHVLGRWERALSDSSVLNLQLYYDRTDRDNRLQYAMVQDTVDLDLQHRFALGTRQEVVWGLQYRYISSIGEPKGFALIPRTRGLHLASAFVQDEIALIRDRLSVTLGTKLEHNDYTGFEVQPNARALWTPHNDHTVWGAVSRAVRTPSRVEHDGRLPSVVVPPGSQGPGDPPLPTLMVLLGSRDFRSEALTAFEVGYRLRPTDRLSLDLAAFYHLYDNLRTLEMGAPYMEPFPPPHLLVPVTAGNKMRGSTYGVELAADWRVRDWWRLQGAYGFLLMDLTFSRSSTDTLSRGMEGQSPRNQLSLISSLDLPGNLEWDLWFRYVDGLVDLSVPAYVTMDARLAWKPIPPVEVSVVGQNLFHDFHPEYVGELFPSVPVEVPRSVYARVTLRF